LTAISSQAQLLRGFAVDFLTAHSAEAARKILAPQYRLAISGHVFKGREETYLPATLAQLDQFPGLCVTVHDVVLGRDAVAMRFTEHGATAKDGVVSTWGGVTMFRIVDGLLDHGWAEEDYFARKRQLKSGNIDPLRAPHAAPWDTALQEDNATTSRIVKAWLDDPAALFEDVEEISTEGPRLSQVIEPQAVEVGFSFVAGQRAAFHAVVSGKYLGGFTDVTPERIGEIVNVPVAAIVDIVGGKVSRVQLCGDRLGLSRSLMVPR
jgi:hypothetical protein